jgi:hypothetical protein
MMKKKVNNEQTDAIFDFELLNFKNHLLLLLFLLFEDFVPPINK